MDVGQLVTILVSFEVAARSIALDQYWQSSLSVGIYGMPVLPFGTRNFGPGQVRFTDHYMELGIMPDHSLSGRVMLQARTREVGIGGWDAPWTKLDEWEITVSPVPGESKARKKSNWLPVALVGLGVVAAVGLGSAKRTKAKNKSST